MMPKLHNATPKYRLHRASGQAVVTLNGKVHYLGPWKSKASLVEYDRLIGEWLAAGRCLPSVAGDTTINELCAAYVRFAAVYYRKNGEPTRSIERVRMAVRHLRELYGSTLAIDFGPLALRAIQDRFVSQRKGRKYVNYLTAEIKRIFKWGVSREMVPAIVFHALSTVQGLRKGRTEAPESEPVRPVALDVVERDTPLLARCGGGHGSAPSTNGLPAWRDLPIATGRRRSLG